MTARTNETKSRRRSRGALFVIASLLAASGALRLSSGTGLAIAREIEPLLSTAESVHGAPLANAHPSADDGLDTLLAALEVRESRVDQQEAELKARVAAFEARAARRTAALAEADHEIERNLEALVAAERALEETITYAATAAEEDLAKLTAVYENMKPKSAAALFEEMSPEFSAGFLGRMRADAAAAILAGMTAEKAYSVSVILAGRNARVPSD